MRGRLLLFLFACSPAVAFADRIDDLRSALVGDPSYKVRVQAVLALGRSGEPRAVPVLLEALRDDNETVRGFAVQALGLLGDARALEPVRAMRRDPSAYVRGRAEQVLPAFEAAVNRERSGAPVGRGRPALPTPPANARFFVTADVKVRGGPSELAVSLGDQIRREVAKLPRVAVTLPAGKAGKGPAGMPTAEQVAAQRWVGFSVEGTLKFLPGSSQLDCAWNGVIAAWPSHAIKAMNSATLSVPGVRRVSDGADQCVEALAGVLADEAKKFLRTVK